MSFDWLKPWGFGAWWNRWAQIVPTPTQQGIAPSEPVERGSVIYGGGAFCLPSLVPVPPLTDNTMRLMSAHSTLAFIFANIVKPISASTLTVEINPTLKDKVPGAELQRRKGVLESASAAVMAAVRSACRGLQYGRWTQEVIYDQVDGYKVPVRFKSFLPWEVQLLKDKFDDFAGFRYMQSDRDSRYAFHYVNDPELDPIFGYSRHANVIQEWWQKLQNAVQLANLGVAANSIVPIVKGPTGSRLGADGTLQSGVDICKNIAAALARCEPVYMPQYIFDDENMDARNPELAKFTAFDIETVDLGDKGPAMSAILETQAYADVSMSRGWCQPERASMEGSHGTKAEAGVHKGGGIEDSETVFNDIVAAINCSIVKLVLIENFGEDAVGSVYYKAAQLQDPDKEFKQAMITAGMQSQSGSEILINIDQRALLEEQEVPLLEESKVNAARAELEKKQADAAKQAQATGANGNGKVNGNGSAAKLAAAVDIAERFVGYFNPDHE